MSARIRVLLNSEEDRSLFELRTAITVPQRVKDRAEVIRLSGHGWYVEKKAAYYNWAPQTVRETIHRWKTFGLGGLWEAEGRGGKSKLQEADMTYLEECLKFEPRTYNSHQLAQKLANDRQVTLSPDRIRRVLKKRG